MKKIHIKKNHLFLFFKSAFWFLVGIVLGLFFTLSFAFIIFQKIYGNTIYPGVYINMINIGGKTEQQVKEYFDKQNQKIENASFTFVYSDQLATTSAKDLHLGYNSQLLAHQAYTIGRSNYILSDIVLVFKAYLTGIFLPPSYAYSDNALMTTLAPISKNTTIAPVDAQFVFQNGRVTTFQPSSEGQEVNIDKVKDMVSSKIPYLVTFGKVQSFTIPVQTRVLKPHVATGDANNLGIKELIGTGTSLYQHSIPTRVFNVGLASSRINGVLVAPDEVFSFAKALGDVSKFTGYQQAYIIANGKTVLGDGGGVCQVSTTLFRAILNAGLPIVERHGHAYRVGYYEEDSPPGIDATVYVPTVDLKFKNDTGHYILIQEVNDPNELRLTFYLYGTKDNRQVTMTQPVVTNQTPAPPPLYTDDPTLPKGVVKQIDFAAAGASVSFSRTVTKNGSVLYNDTFVTNYQAWQASYLRGTKE